MEKKKWIEIKKMHDALSWTPRMQSCEVLDTSCSKTLERHHALIYAGKQIEEDFAIRSLCKRHHRGNNGTIDRRADLVCKINAITDGLDQLKRDYPRTNWEQELKKYQSKLREYEKSRS